MHTQVIIRADTVGALKGHAIWGALMEMFLTGGSVEVVQLQILDQPVERPDDSDDSDRAAT